MNPIGLRVAFVVLTALTVVVVVDTTESAYNGETTEVSTLEIGDLRAGEAEATGVAAVADHSVEPRSPICSSRQQRCVRILYSGHRSTTIRCIRDSHCVSIGLGRCCRVGRSSRQGCCVVTVTGGRPRTTTERGHRRGTGDRERESTSELTGKKESDPKKRDESEESEDDPEDESDDSDDSDESDESEESDDESEESEKTKSTKDSEHHKHKPHKEKKSEKKKEKKKPKTTTERSDVISSLLTLLVNRSPL